MFAIPLLPIISLACLKRGIGGDGGDHFCRFFYILKMNCALINTDFIIKVRIHFEGALFIDIKNFLILDVQCLIILYGQLIVYLSV